MARPVAGGAPLVSEKFEQTLTRICVGLVIAGPTLGLAAGALGAAEIYPSDHMLPVALTVMLSVVAGPYKNCEHPYTTCGHACTTCGHGGIRRSGPRGR